MKIWIKYLIGIALGFVAALVLPFKNPQWNETLAFLAELIVQIGRYTLVPLLFFSGIMAAYRLRNEGILLQTAIWTFITIILSSLLLSALGFFVSFVKLPRIPINTEHANDFFSIDIQNFLRTIFPYSAFDALNNGAFILPVFVFAMTIGAGLCIRQSNLKHLISLLDATSELFYNISSVFVELFSAGMVFVMCFWTVQFRDVIKSGIFFPLVLTLLISFVIIVGIIFPLIVKFSCQNGKPLKILSASPVPFFTAFFSGDANLSLSAQIKMGKENLGIRQKTNGFGFPLFSIFARGGTIFVVIISFVAIRRSYNDLQIEFFDLLLISLVAFLLSFALGNIPAGGAFTELAILCAWYGRGMENGFLLLKPAAAILGSFAALFDAAIAMFGCYIIAHNTKTIERHHI